jgi:hypothetical protein
MSSVRFDRYRPCWLSRATSLPTASLTLRAQYRRCLRAEAARARFGKVKGAPKTPPGGTFPPWCHPVERFRDYQAVFFRRRHQPRSPPLAKIRPGRRSSATHG